MVIHDLRNPIVSQQQSINMLLDKLSKLGAYKNIQDQMNEASKKLTDSLSKSIMGAR